MFKIRIDCYVCGMVYSSVYGDFICCFDVLDHVNMNDYAVAELNKYSKYLTYTIVEVRTFDELGDYCRGEVLMVYAILKDHFESIITDMAARSTIDWLHALYTYSCEINDNQMRRICFEELISRGVKVEQVHK